MGKASRWFRGLIGLRSSAATSHNQSSKRKWSFTKSRKDKEKDRQEGEHGNVDDDDASKRAIAVAAATAAVAEAAVFAAQAAAAVVQLTSSGRIFAAGHRSREDRAAVTIQSHFRAYLSRRALRALKALVRLQALVRGHLVRKQTACVLRRLQALVRAQVRARVGRAPVSESPHSSMKSSVLYYLRHGSKSRSANNNPGGLLEQSPLTRPLTADDYQPDKVLEVDSGKPHIASKSRSFFPYANFSHGSDKNCLTFSTSKDSTAHQSVQSPSLEVQSFSRPLNYAQDAIESAYCTADNSPTFYSASSMGSSKRGAFTPTSSDCSRSCLSGYSDHPNYMAYTESSKAKVRSFSAPKLRPQYERSSSAKRFSIHTFGESRSAHRGSSLHDKFTKKAYPGSGRLDRLGIPTRGDICGNWQRY